ncbi:MAG: DNA-binding protein YbiB [Rhodocyclales bacterium]|nr:DNA-binding protein YbiB [Rhodocyclales bacterium]
MNFATIIKEIGRGAKGAKPIDGASAEALFGAMLDGTVPDLELGAIIIALRIKSESVDELAGFQRAMDARCAQLAVPDGPRCVVLPTYNGARRQANLMPLVALLLTREGVPVLIQGRHDFDSRSNPFELLTALDLPLSPDAAHATTQLAQRRIACLDVDQLLPGLARLLALRLRLGVRGSAHTMAKLIDPCQGRSVRVVAVTHPEYLERMDELLAATRACALLMRGTEGEAYANPRRRPRIMAYRDGLADIAWPAEEGGAPPLSGLPDAPGIADNAALIRAMLAGQTPIPQPVLDQVAALAELARRD